MSFRLGSTEFANAQAVLDALDAEFAGKGAPPGQNPDTMPGAWLGTVVKAMPAWRDALVDGLVARTQSLPPEQAYLALRLLGDGLQSARLAGLLLDAVDAIPAAVRYEAFSLIARCLAVGKPPGALARVQALFAAHPAAWVAWQALAPKAALPHLADALGRANPDEAQAIAVAAVDDAAGTLALAEHGPSLAAPLQAKVGHVLRAHLQGKATGNKALATKLDKLWPDRPR